MVDVAIDAATLPAPRGPVVVTGGASGLGAAVVRALVARHDHPVVIDRRPPDAEVEHEVVDVADRVAVEAAIGRIVARHPAWTGVVTAAGIDACGPLEDVSPEDWEQVVRVNLFGTAAVLRAAFPALARGSGRAVTVASTLGLRACSDATAYCASKFGVVGLTRALAAEWAGRVGVTLLVPGGMATPFFDGRAEQYRPPADLTLADPDAVAAAVVGVLDQPAGLDLRELLLCAPSEASWP